MNRREFLHLMPLLGGLTFPFSLSSPKMGVDMAAEDGEETASGITFPLTFPFVFADSSAASSQEKVEHKVHIPIIRR